MRTRWSGAHLDHFEVGATERFAWPEECGHYSMLGMGVNAGGGIAMSVGEHEERGALAFLKSLDFGWQLQILAVYVLHKQILRFHALFLYARGRYVDLITAKCAFNVRRQLLRYLGPTLYTCLCLMVMPPPVPVTQPR